MIWLIGCKGMLGSEVAKQLDENKINWIGTDREVDITDYKALQDFVTSIEKEFYLHTELPVSERRIKWIINCAAFTNVEESESNKELADQLNSIGPTNIARIARNISAKLIHISTDYVFDGKKNCPYLEDDEKFPINYYGTSKFNGENSIQKEMNTYYILRTAWLYGANGNNFVYKMIDLMNQNNSIKVISDQVGSPTYTGDLAKVIIKIIDKSEIAKSFFGKNSAPAYGIYNYSSKGEISRYDFACEIYSLGKKFGKIKNNCKIESCNSDEFETVVKRPAYSVLNKDKIINELKIKIPDWKISLEKFIKNNNFDK